MWFSSLGVGRGANNSSSSVSYCETKGNPRNWTDTLVQPGQRKGLDTWNIRRLYRAGSLTAVPREFVIYKSVLMSGQEVRWDK